MEGWRFHRKSKIIKHIPDGNERIQCVEFIDNFNKPLLIISAYLPTNYEVDVFKDCIDQLYEIFQKFKDTHDILIGGDLNEDLNKSSPDKRGKYIRTFITDCQLTASFSGNTYINPKGEECTEIQDLCGPTTTQAEKLWTGCKDWSRRILCNSMC